MNEHLIIEYNERFNFNKVTCREGHYITDWDKEDIRLFSASKLMYCPVNTDIENFYCITDEEYSKLIEEQEIAIKNDEENRNEGN